MGAWGVGSFDNDDASDWVYELQESEGTELLTPALEAISPDAKLEAPECSMALAAAEVVAALYGQALDALPTEVAAWVNENDVDMDSDLIALALMAIHRIDTDSELKDLWKDSGELDAWSATIRDLESRLSDL